MILAAVVTATGLTACASRHGSGSAEPAFFGVGGCVRVTVEPTTVHGITRVPTQYGAVHCDDRTAYAKITQMGPGGSVLSTPSASTEDLGCPEDTDEIASVRSNLSLETRTACLRNLNAPHPGDPGQGGGLVRSGDCLQVYATYSNNLDEVACTTNDWTVDGVTFGKEWFGQVVGRADAAGGCPPSAIYTITIKSKVTPVICLAKNGGWLPVVGDCVDANTFMRVANRRPCTDRYLALKITALVPQGHTCPGNTRPTAVPGYLSQVCYQHIS